jgi:hypothetical protein
MAENRIRPARVTNEPTDARSVPSVAFNTLAVCRLCAFEIELLAISASLVRYTHRDENFVLVVPRKMIPYGSVKVGDSRNTSADK